MRFIVAGGKGGAPVINGVEADNGAAGAQLSGTVSVTPGQSVVLLAGGRGGIGRTSGVSPGGIGYGTGGTATDSAGGGGAGSSLTLNGRLLVVAGGGGGGGRYTDLADTNPQTVTYSGDSGKGGGFNGNTAYISLRATPNQHTVTIQGGRGGGSSAPGAGGTVSGSPTLSTNGAPGNGMNGGNGRPGLGTTNLGSGGGGSGYYGGGSGAVAQKTVGTNPPAAAGVQGGGGSNYLASGVTATSSTNDRSGFVTVVFFG